MELQDNQRAEELFQQAADLPPAERARFLHERCGGDTDTALLARVRTLLEHHDAVSPAFLAGQQPAEVGKRIGPYTLLSVLGEGGMGTVYEAEQDRPRRRVALKLIRPGFITPATLRRFDYETDVLGRLDHPGIAKVFGAGTADVGMGTQPYFVMELVHGKRLDEFVRDARLSTHQRLKLLIDICSAVHHAHTKGVIHRDLKPGNILVTGDGQPKILDFGVARAINSDMQATTTMATESGQLVGTLPYMAPEQAAGRVRELDTSSDVYALGVIAYEVLSGTMPYQLDGKPLHEAVRVICEQEPTRLSNVDRNLRGDVETIVRKALEKDRSRRYHTAGELAADVKRYLDYEPIAARPPGTWYQLSRFAKRNKALVGGAVAVFVILVSGVIVSTSLYVRAERQRAEAKSQSEIATAVSEFLTNRVLAGATPEQMPNKAVRDEIVKKMLDPAAAAVAQDFKDKPLTEAAVRDSIHVSYRAIGRAELALPHAQAALTLRRRVLGRDHPDTLLSINNVGNLLVAQGKLDQAEPLHRDALQALRRVLGDNHPNTLSSINNLGYLLQAQGKLDQAEPLYREALEGRRRVLGDDHPDTLASINNLAVLLQARGKLSEAEPLHREALERHRRVLGDDHAQTLQSINNTGYLLQEQGKLDQAEPLYREALERHRRVLGDDHPNTLKSINSMATLLQAQGKLDQAEPLYREALERGRRVLGDDHPDTLTWIGNVGYVLRAQGKLDQAEPLYREALERRRRVLDDDHPSTLKSISNLGSLLQAQAKLDEAELLHREALERRRRVLGGDHPDTLTSINNMGGLLKAQGKLEEAERMFREAATKAKVKLGPEHPNTMRFATNLANRLDALGRHDEAAAVRKEFALPAAATTQAQDRPSPATTQMNVQT